MAAYYHCAARRAPYFEGWYLKCQTRDGKALALIPALHIDSAGQRGASLQVLSDSGSCWLEYPAQEFRACEDRFCIHMGPNLFSYQDIWLDVEQKGLSLHGTLHNGLFKALRSDIMGPFRFFPGMECVHGVISMGHPLDGALRLNGETLDFSGGMGYIETDRSRSFPSAYLWTQCIWREPPGGSLMLSIAAIPLAAGHFTGCICAVLWQGREYRLATYRGARVERWSAGGAAIRQGKYRLTADLLTERPQPLRAPVEGRMGRTIRESLCAGVRYRFWKGETLLFEHTDRHASFEYAEAQSRDVSSSAT